MPGSKHQFKTMGFKRPIGPRAPHTPSRNYNVMTSHSCVVDILIINVSFDFHQKSAKRKYSIQPPIFPTNNLLKRVQEQLTKFFFFKFCTKLAVFKGINEISHVHCAKFNPIKILHYYRKARNIFVRAMRKFHIQSKSVALHRMITALTHLHVK